MSKHNSPYNIKNNFSLHKTLKKNHYQFFKSCADYYFNSYQMMIFIYEIII